MAGTRWRDVDGYLSTYGWIISVAMVAALIVWFIRKRRAS
jgi:hypothetical protein